MNDQGLEGIEDLARVARGLQAESDEESQMQLAVDTAVKMIAGCDHAGITMVRGRNLTIGASSDDIVRQGDELQYELNEGPCLDTVRSHETVVSQDLSRDRRWPQWSLQVRERLGVNAMMSLLLYTNARSYGAINLYADKPNAYDSDDYAVAQALAAQIAVALAAVREIDERGTAMVNRTVIGQAEGILMERFGISADQAFAYLRRVSQETNRKLLALCSEIVETRVLPTADRTRR